MAEAAASLIEAEGLTKGYEARGTRAEVLCGASFALRRGETVSMVGSSGAGKSTLLAVLAGLLLPDAGEVRFDGEVLTGMDEAGRARLRARRIGVVLQSDNLIAFLTAAENVELAVQLAGGDRPARRARELLGELGIGHRVDERPSRLSGGEAQRAALAVALVNEPDLLLADEVTAELDSASAEAVLELILSASAQRGLTVLVVTHSPALAGLTARRLWVADGCVTEA